MAGYRPELFTPPSGFGFYASNGPRAEEWLDREETGEQPESDVDDSENES